MKRLRRRTIIALVLAGALAAGVLFFCFQLIGKGNDWVGFFGTRYYDSGAIYDRNGVLLYDGQTKSYAENQATRGVHPSPGGGPEFRHLPALSAGQPADRL